MATEQWQPATAPDSGDRWSGVETGAGVQAWRRLRSRDRVTRSPGFLAGAAVMLFWMVDAVAWRVLVPHDPQAVSAGRTLQAPSADHWFGTDDLGRDVFSRVLAGASSVLTVAPAAALLAVSAGIAVVLAPLTARTIRAAVRAEREREYVEAARLRGDSAPYIMVAEILPNVTTLVVAEATARFAAAIFAAATLSFLGLGIEQPSPDWGLSVALGRVFLQTAPWIVLFPALALATLVLATTLVADGLRLRIER